MHQRLKKRIAVVGSGISGLGAAYLLHRSCDITLYEKNAVLGGHSRTLTVPLAGVDTPVDTGFIVFNNWNYPHLMGLFHLIGVPYEKSDMSFGVSINHGELEYSSNGLFAQRRNLIRPSFYRMLLDVLRFNRQAKAYLTQSPQVSLGECLDRLNMGDWFRRYYLLAMGAAIWSCPLETMMRYPAATFIRFFDNHGLLNINHRPQWYTVTGGSREYVRRLIAPFQNKIRLNAGVVRVQQNDVAGGRIGHEVITADGHREHYDEVVLACHADEALAIIQSPSDGQRAVLQAFSYQRNRVVLHQDVSFMPKRRACWASWVYLSEAYPSGIQSSTIENKVVSLTYWMNNLQNIHSAAPLLITLNPARDPDPSSIVDEHYFTHPIFDEGAIMAQQKVADIQGQNGLWFCGAYQRYGFHEDGLLSAVKVAEKMGICVPWEIAQ